MIVDLHNHTTLCHHATGSMEEYVQKAIEKKIDIFGFSDHAPMNFDTYRMRFEEMPFYEQEVLRLKDQYAQDITLVLGYEVDFLQGYIDERVLKRDVDYLIGSVHYLGQWGFDNPEYIGEYQKKDLNQIWQDYFDAIEAMAKSGLFDIVGHIDLMKVFNYFPTKDIRLLAKNAIQAIKKANMVVEINAAGLRKPVAKPYPSDSIMQLLAEHDIPITFGSDAHAPEHVGFGRDTIHTLAKTYGYQQCAMFKNKDRLLVNF